MKNKTNEIRYLLQIFFILFLIAAFISLGELFFDKEPSYLDISLGLLAIGLTIILMSINLLNTTFTRDTLDFDKKKNDVELKQKQLELFYYPLLLSIKECQNSPVRTKNGIDQLFKYQYLILNSDFQMIPEIKKTFQDYADINYKETPKELDDFKYKVKTEIDKIELELENLYKNLSYNFGSVENRS